MVPNGQEAVFRKAADDDGRNEDGFVPPTSCQDQITGNEEMELLDRFEPLLSVPK